MPLGIRDDFRPFTTSTSSVHTSSTYDETPLPNEDAIHNMHELTRGDAIEADAFATLMEGYAGPRDRNPPMSDREDPQELGEGVDIPQTLPQHVDDNVQWSRMEEDAHLPLYSSSTCSRYKLYTLTFSISILTLTLT